jgi:peptidoglycan glycosyltransferase
VPRRIRWLGLVILACFVVLFLQLNNLQVLKAQQYATHCTPSSCNPAVSIKKFDQTRGAIVSSDGVVLADSVPAPSRSLYKYQRQYPTGPLFGQITGVTSFDYGLYGLEATYNTQLVSHNSPVKTLGDLLSTRSVTDTVTLTMSDKLQTEVMNALSGRDGAIVVLDPSTGAIEAMYSNPTFDPNPLASQTDETEVSAWHQDNFVPDSQGHLPFTSLAYQDIAFPGSTFKIVTTAATYQHAPSLVGASMPFYTCIPPKTLGGQSTPLCNYGNSGCGGDIATMLPPSCDTGFAILGTKVGAPSMVAEANSFGFNQQPPIDLPHSADQVSQFLQPSCYENAEIFLAFSSIGQFCTKSTPLQMAMVAGAIANGGVVMTPHVMSEIRDSQGNLVESYKPKPWLTPTSAQTASAINNLMVGVTHDSNGTAAGIFPANEDVAAKTGTAQVENSSGAYIATNDWMIAFAPASAPKVAVAVYLPNQPVSGTGAANAGPVMAQVIQDALATP